MTFLLKNYLLKIIFNHLSYGNGKRSFKIASFYKRMFGLDSHIALTLCYVYSQLELNEQFNKQVELTEKYFENTGYINGIRAENLARQKKLMKPSRH